jgi:SAM-dependent methyltransferase
MGALELSDLIVDIDPVTLTRRRVRVADVEARFAAVGDRWAIRLLRGLRSTDGYLDTDAVDNLLVRVHSELSRLGRELALPMRLRALLAPVVAEIRAQGHDGPVRIVDVGCGTGYATRWLARRGDLGPDVEYVGCDYNAALIAEAQRLATGEGLPCTFEVADALHRSQAATIVTSSCLLHHFRDGALHAFFAAHDPESARAFLHFDITPSPAALRFVGAWIFHVARMRLALSRHDGVISAMRAHADATVARAATAGAPWAEVSILGPAGTGSVFVNILRPVVGLDPVLAAGVRARLGRRAQRLVPAQRWA